MPAPVCNIYSGDQCNFPFQWRNSYLAGEMNLPLRQYADFQRTLLYGHALGKIPGPVNIEAFECGNVVGEEL